MVAAIIKIHLGLLNLGSLGLLDQLLRIKIMLLRLGLPPRLILVAILLLTEGKTAGSVLLVDWVVLLGRLADCGRVEWHWEASVASLSLKLAGHLFRAVNLIPGHLLKSELAS